MTALSIPLAAAALDSVVEEQQSEVQTPVSVPSIDQIVGNTPLVRLQRLHVPLNPGGNNQVYVKLEGANPGGSAKDRPALGMLTAAEASGRLQPGGRVIECTTGNTGIALAMACAARGYKLRIIMPASMTEERKAAIAAYGAELVLVPSLEGGRDLARRMADAGEGVLLDQNNNPANPASHRSGTGPEIWAQTGGAVTHFIAGMGTSGTIMGVSAALKARNPAVQAIGLEPPSDEPTSVPGIRAWPTQYRPRVRDESLLDDVMKVSRREAEETARALARTEGLLLGISAAGAVSGALRLCAHVSNAVIVVLACDRADRYLSTGVYSAAAGAADPQPCPVSEMASAVARFMAHPAPHFMWLSHAAQEAVGEVEAAALQQDAQARVAAQGGTLLVVRGQLDCSSEAVQRMLPPSATQAAAAGDAPVLVQWHGAEAATSASRAVGGHGCCGASATSVLISQSMLKC